MKKSKDLLMLLMASAMFFIFQFNSAQTPECDEPVEAGIYDMGRMWTFDNPPVEYFRTTYNFNPDQAWFEKARLSSLRFADYCSASFVSANGLVMTNHHCSRDAGVSAQRAGEDILENGFYAAKTADERRVQGLYVDQLVMIEDITEKVQSALSGIQNDFERLGAIEAKLASVKKEYAQREQWKGLELETIRFYNGGKYSLYGFKRYNDVRLVFMPEERIAYFGGDYDNFTFPRYDLDCSFFRVYDEGKPLSTENFFRYSVNGASEGDAVFVIGNPGSTSRMSTVSDLEFYRDKQLPYTIDILSGVSEMYKEINAKDKSDSLENLIFSLENSLKVYRGELKGLGDPCNIARKASFEAKFRSDAIRNPSLVKDTVIWSDIKQMNDIRKQVFDEVSILNAGSPFVTGQLMQYAMGAVSLAVAYPDTAGAGEFRTAMSVPVDPDDLATEPEVLTMYLKQAAERLGTDHPFVSTALKGRTPEAAAEGILSGTKIADTGFRSELLRMDSAAIWNVNDPLVELARIAHSRGDDIAMIYRSVEARLVSSRTRLGEMLFETYGTTIPPDATFSLRINDGVVKGYEYNGTMAPVNTTFYGLYDRYHSFNGKEPWDLPARWERVDQRLLNTPLNFVSTNDIVGGNSGSPIINKELEVVGLAFDGNIESLLGSYIYVPEENRAVGVHSAGIISALRYVYKAKRLVAELEGK